MFQKRIYIKIDILLHNSNMKNFNPVKSEKTVISIRIDNELLKTVDEVSFKTDISRNELIVQCIEYALNNM